MGWLTDLIREYPAVSVAEQRLSLIEEKLRAAEEENRKLREENKGLRSSAARIEKRKKFTEYNGVLWKEFDGVFETIAYCPECELAMFAFPPSSDEILLCSKCHFTAPFTPNEVKALAKKLEVERLSA